jgi:ribosomal protein S27E
VAKKAQKKAKRPGKESTRWGEVRCLNCFDRPRVPARAEKITCPTCGWEWRISWVNPELPKVRGPVWEKMRF